MENTGMFTRHAEDAGTLTVPPLRFLGLYHIGIAFTRAREMVYSGAPLWRATLLSFYLFLSFFLEAPNSSLFFFYLLLERDEEALPLKTLVIGHLRHNWAP